MGLTYGKVELMQDLQKVFAKHNVQAIKVDEPGVLFQVEADGSLKIGVKMIVKPFEQQPDSKKPFKFQLLNGGNQKEK
ncbi:hypothetical protein MUN89_01790 [Halobacillus salinarum]|uniref:Uncharacterized protein n=1 Tax=Halobacillus salinarum TaxID=2932257 RepID=A0ABY4EL64_9BACI|nr:hypothetical protein [Halobacillus salinarum]UOQ44720.1 hypothetical protein MUN89_01790 [Halobacillus salinarum]